MRTQGEFEAAICEGVTRFEQEYMGRGPKNIHTHLLGNLLVVRLEGVLTAAEQHLVCHAGFLLNRLGLAARAGAQTVKMKFGHHGANHPVQDLATGQVMITSQNHGFAVDEESLPEHMKATHRSLFDGSLQGIQRTDKPAFGFQGHPEASPGPHDIAPVFDHFIELMEKKLTN